MPPRCLDFESQNKRVSKLIPSILSGIRSIERAVFAFNSFTPECLMEFCKVTLTFESADDSYDVTIHMKALYLYLHMVLICF